MVQHGNRDGGSEIVVNKFCTIPVVLSSRSVMMKSLVNTTFTSFSAS